MRVEQVYWYCFIKRHADYQILRGRGRHAGPLYSALLCHVSAVSANPTQKGPPMLGKTNIQEASATPQAALPVHPPSSPPFGRPRSGFAWWCSVQKGLVMHAWHGMAWEASFGLFGACQLLEDQMEHAQSHQRAPFSPAALL